MLVARGRHHYGFEIKRTTAPRITPSMRSALEDLQLTFHARAGEESKLFGSIGNADIADRLNQQEIDFEVDRRAVELEEPIKALGVYDVAIKLHAEVRPEVKVWVIKEE